MNPVKTPGERARREILLDDPLVNLLSPSLVECKLCTKSIKLSAKSAYDTHHWLNHRSRCLRMMKKKKGSSSRRTVSSPLKTASSIKTSTKEPESESEPRRMQTPPLVELSDSEEESRGSPATETSHTPQLPPFSPQSSIYVTPSESALGEYILRSHPECTQQATALSCHWQNWSWAQLKEPQFAPPPHNHPIDADFDEDPYSDYDYRYQSHSVLQHLPRCGGLGRVVADLRDQEAAHALSMLSRSR